MVVGRESDVREKLETAGLGDAYRELTVVNSVNSKHIEAYKDFLYTRLQRQGVDREDAHKLATRLKAHHIRDVFPHLCPCFV